MSLDLILLVSGLFLSAISVYLLATSIFKPHSDKEALALVSSEDESSKSSIPLIQISKPLVYNLTLGHATRIRWPKYRKSIEAKISHSGLLKQLTVDEFIGLQILWGGMFPLFAMFLNFALQMGYPHFVFPLIGAFGIYFPHFYLKSLILKRQKMVERDLPFFIDLLALSTEAGLDFVSAIQKLSDKGTKDSVLVEEFHILLKEIKLGSSRKDALLNMNKRIQSSELKSFVTMICDADETGASIATTLKAKSEQMRYQRFNKAEEMGSKASQKILIPMMLFIMPAVLLTVLGPVALQFYYGGG